MGELLRRIRYLFNRRRFDTELQSDMEFHREMAAREGRRDFGNTLHMRELAQDEWGWTWLEDLMQDLRWSVRGLRRAPGSALAMIVLLALGMGGVTALFGPLYSLVLRPLPFPRSSQLVRIDNGSPLLDLYAENTVFRNRRALDPIFSDAMAYPLTKPLYPLAVRPSESISSPSRANSFRPSGCSHGWAATIQPTRP